MKNNNYAIAKLKTELIEWEQEFESEKEYFKGEEDHKLAIKSFSRCEENISSLKKAIEILERES